MCVPPRMCIPPDPCARWHFHVLKKRRSGIKSCARLQIRLVAVSEKVLTHLLIADAKCVGRGLWMKIPP